jgi:hypothetical protein
MFSSSVSDPENPRKQQARGDLRSVTAAPQAPPLELRGNLLRADETLVGTQTDGHLPFKKLRKRFCERASFGYHPSLQPLFFCLGATLR